MLSGPHRRRRRTLANRSLAIPAILVRHNHLFHLIDVLRSVPVSRQNASRVDVVAVVDLDRLAAGCDHAILAVVTAAYFACDQSVHPVAGLSASVGT